MIRLPRATEETAAFLTGMMEFESVQGSECEVQELARRQFANAGLDTRLAAIAEEIIGDPEYTRSPGRVISYQTV
jgi:hypothetical protein